MNKTIAIILIGATLIFSGCSVKSGVMPIGQDTYMISNRAASGFTDTTAIKAEGLKEALDYCTNQKKIFKVTQINDTKPPYVFGNYPKTEIQFMCLDKNDPDLKRQTLHKEADTVIEVH